MGGNLAGIVFIVPALSMVLGAPVWSPDWHHGFQSVSGVLLMFVVAALGVAPWRRLLWIFVPPVLWLFWSVTDRLVTHNWPGLIHDLRLNVVGAGLYLVTGCFFALIQGKFGRGLETDGIKAEPTPQMEASESVWPPPPRRAE